MSYIFFIMGLIVISCMIWCAFDVGWKDMIKPTFFFFLVFGYGLLILGFLLK